MNCFYSRSLILLSLLLFHTFDSLPAQSKSKVPLSPNKYIEDLFVNMEKNKRLIERENYEGAQVYSDQVMETLERLENIFMPIDERIKIARDEEQKILYEIKGIVKNGSSSNSNHSNKKLQQRQLANKQKTKLAIKIIKQHKEQLLQQQEKGQTSASTQKAPINDLEKIKKIHTLLKSALDSEKAVIKYLNEDFMEAQRQAQRSYEKLDEALQLLKDKQDSEQSQNQKNKNSDNQQENQESEGKKSQNKQNQENQKSGEPKKDSESKQKTSSKEALKELARLMKQQDDDKKEKEKKYGQPNMPSQIPVEKDW